MLRNDQYFFAASSYRCKSRPPEATSHKKTPQPIATAAACQPLAFNKSKNLEKSGNAIDQLHFIAHYIAPKETQTYKSLK
jgi:hypothetical protein